MIKVLQSQSRIYFIFFVRRIIDYHSYKQEDENKRYVIKISNHNIEYG